MSHCAYACLLLAARRKVTACKIAVVLRHAVTFAVGKPEGVLSVQLALVGGAAEGLGIVLVLRHVMPN